MTEQTTEVALSREWYTKIEAQASSNFINLPLQFQMKGYTYDKISSTYLKFFQGEGTRLAKLKLARKFLKFVRSINKNRARQELGEDFFKCFSYFMENFSELTVKMDAIHLETLDIITEAMDKSQFVEDIISIDELKQRVKNLEHVQEKEVEIKLVFDTDLSDEYIKLNNPETRNEYLLNSGLNTGGAVDEHS